MPPWLFTLKGVSHGAKVCYAYLTLFDGQPLPELPELAEGLGVCRRQAATYLQILRAARLLKVGVRNTEFVWPALDGAEAIERVQDRASETTSAEVQDAALQADAEMQHPALEATERVQDAAPMPPQGTPAFPPTPPIPPPRNEVRPARQAVKKPLASAPEGKSAPAQMSDQSFRIAVQKCCSHYTAEYRKRFPDRPPPVVIERSKQAVRSALKAVAEADGCDYLQAEAEVKRLISLLLQEDEPFVVRAGHDLAVLTTKLSGLRAARAKREDRRDEAPDGQREDRWKQYLTN